MSTKSIINKPIRGIRDTIPGGYFLGRTGNGSGPPILLPLSMFTTPGQVANTTIAVNSPAGGDLSGTYPNPTVSGLQGRSVKNTAPSDTQVLTWVAADSAWEPKAGGGGGSSTPTFYSSTYFSQNAFNAAFATTGAIFVPDQNITVSQVEAWVKPASAGLTVKFSIVSLNAGGLVINSQLYVSPSNITTSGTGWQKVVQLLASPLALTAGTAYAILITGTNLASSTTAMPMGWTATSFGAAVAHDGWLNMPKQQIPGAIGGASGDVLVFAEFASLTPPTSGTLSNGDGEAPNIMLYWNFSLAPP